MQNPDSFDRIVSYFHALASADFEYRGQVFKHYPELHVSPLVFRSYTCPEGCGACCMRCSLVWHQKPPTTACVEREVAVNGVSRTWYADMQEDHTDRFCRYLDQSNGRCGIYTERPLPCRFELFKFVHSPVRGLARASVRLPGRGWTLTRIDGLKGAKCETTPYDPELTQTHIHDLEIIKGWMQDFGIPNDAERVLLYLSSGPHANALRIVRHQESLLE